MKLNLVRWRVAMIGAVIAEVALIASSFGWVAIYSYLINPGQPLATYQQHAIASGPWVSIVMGMPIFYAAGRWIAKTIPTAWALCGIVIAFDASVLAISGTAGLPIAFLAASYITKLLASRLGGTHGANSAQRAAQMP